MATIDPLGMGIWRATVLSCFFCASQDGKDRQVSIMIQQEVKLHSPFGLPEVRPGKEGQAQRDGRAVKGKKLVLELELLFEMPATVLTHLECFVKEVLEHFPGSVAIGIGQSGFVGCFLQTQVSYLAYSAGNPTADLPEALGLGQLAE